MVLLAVLTPVRYVEMLLGIAVPASALRVTYQSVGSNRLLARDFVLSFHTVLRPLFTS